MGAELLFLCLAFDRAKLLPLKHLHLGMPAWLSLATDSKQVYGAVARSTVMQEKRLTMPMLPLREGMSNLQSRELLRMPGSQTVADALAKVKGCGLNGRGC
ncbi:hypothetical protein FVE85_3818 [Porphyridium purpureum]|uniref:Uncharacterized protein n=1 Tax=Porphyridium purpureum TaxID=35688 RepID=A0A5J4YGS9_PORPP|nr:hypothetical protein FVE85_3818 [Porphyridium purpureum]|eukprot:POR7925..scf243_20